MGEDRGKEKYYLLEMFPYPSGRIHMGHVRNYTIGDVVARFMRMLGYNVLHPMGWDAFGMPAENAAIKAGTHPAKWTYDNIDYMRNQLKQLGFSYDWSREFATCDPSYYRWEQLFFLKMYDRGLAYRKSSYVNWCSKCQTVLANEQVEGGRLLALRHSGRTKGDGAVVFQDYRLCRRTARLYIQAARLARAGACHAAELDREKHWKHVALSARIGRGKHCGLYDPHGHAFRGYLHEHGPGTSDGRRPVPGKARRRPQCSILSKGQSGRSAMSAKPNCSKKRAYLPEATASTRSPGKRCRFTWPTSLLMAYGTGAVMAVPAHDQRDFEFAKKYGLPIKVVIKPAEAEQAPLAQDLTHAFEEDGVLVDSGEFTGMDSAAARNAITEALAKRGLAELTVQYRLRDWGISRQRYWGAPIPIIYCEKCGVVPVPEQDLPVVLPLDVELLENGGSPLPVHKPFYSTTCPKCGADARRETDTMDTFVESSWYFARYACPDFDKGPLDRERVRYWMPVDQYIGGIEHAVLHLLYSRFFVKVLRDMGYLEVDEPFLNLLTQGMVIKDGFKMSKSKGNVVDPDEMIQAYGADTVRLFCLFASPPEKDLDWSDQGVEGSFRFLSRMWRLVSENLRRPEIR